MDRYIIISEHTAEECVAAVKYFVNYHAGFLTHFEWGCKDNDHHAYAIVEADDHLTASLMVPPLFREKAKIVKLTHFEAKNKEDHLHSSK
jgi:hypothetical protein